MSQIIQTRYRDIPWEEAMKCLTPAGLSHGVGKPQWDSELKNKLVAIETPPFGETNKYVGCGGPLYMVAGHPNRLVCPHIAEIGD